MSSIEWTDRTWNPVRGCSKVSKGCLNCYAERIAMRFGGTGDPHSERRFPFEFFADPDGWTGRVALLEHKLPEPLSWRKPAKVFVNSMSDLFHEQLSDDDIHAVFAVMALATKHTFQVLTKR